MDAENVDKKTNGMLKRVKNKSEYMFAVAINVT